MKRKSTIQPSAYQNRVVQFGDHVRMPPGTSVLSHCSATSVSQLTIRHENFFPEDWPLLFFKMKLGDQQVVFRPLLSDCYYMKLSIFFSVDITKRPFLLVKFKQNFIFLLYLICLAMLEIFLQDKSITYSNYEVSGKTLLN